MTLFVSPQDDVSLFASTQRILAAESFTELRRLSTLSARTGLSGLMWTTSRIQADICEWVGFSMLAFSYPGRGTGLCRHFSLRTWSVYGTTVLED